jgi:CubicO group peptidase (beta-lactamase class C family)
LIQPTQKCIRNQLGLILEKLTGKPYGEALKERITSKIGLKNTCIATGNIDVNKNEALTYRNLGEWKQEPETHPSILFGGGSIKCKGRSCMKLFVRISI